MNENIIVVGDVHGEWEILSGLIKDAKPELVICCGDFGYYPQMVGQTVLSSTGRRRKILSVAEGLKNGKTKVLFCDGNHEDHWSLRALVDTEIAPNVFYMPRGSTYILPDKRKILFMGGAYSIDKPARRFGYDWFPEEQISNADVMRCPNEAIDIVVSHTCPKRLRPQILKRKNSVGLGFDIPDTSEDALEYILNSYQPKYWYFGHWHMYMSGQLVTPNTKWYMLNAIGDIRWWMFLQ